MLFARTNAEAHLYMDLHPCKCGEAQFERDSALVENGDDLASVYEGACRGCGATRRVEFLLPDAMPRVGPGLVYGGSEPSVIIDPGEFLLISDERARRVPASPDGLTEAARSRARRDIAIALACIEEVWTGMRPLSLRKRMEEAASQDLPADSD